MKEATWSQVLLAGAGGGLAFWAFTLSRGGLPGGGLALFDRATWLWISLVIAPMLGASASFLMVYFVAPTDTKQGMRALGFAAVSGLCWDPVLSGTIDRFTKEYRDEDAAKQVTAAQQLAPSPRETPPPEKAADAAADLIRTAPAVQNPVLKAQVTDEAEKLLHSVQQGTDSTIKTDALQKIGLAAADARAPSMLAQTVKSLETIASSQPEHSVRVRSAIEAIRNQAIAAAKKE